MTAIMHLHSLNCSINTNTVPVIVQFVCRLMAHDSYYCNATHLKSKVIWGFPTKRYGKVIAANYAAADGSVVPVDSQVVEIPIPCRRNPTWTFG